MMSPNPELRSQTGRRPLDRAAYERFLPMVRRIAMKVARRLPPSIALADLVSCGWVGLLEAYARATPGMSDDEFEAYASYRVRGAMLDHLRSLDVGSREMRRQSRLLARAIREETQARGRAPTEAEIATAMGIDERAFRDLLTRLDRAGMARLEMMDFDQMDARADDQPLPDDAASSREVSGAVASAVETLPERLQQVLALYYQHGCTLREAGEVLGVSESRVSQLHTEAMHRLRAAIGRE